MKLTIFDNVSILFVLNNFMNTGLDVKVSRLSSVTLLSLSFVHSSDVCIFIVGAWRSMLLVF